MELTRRHPSLIAEVLTQAMSQLTGGAQPTPRDSHRLMTSSELRQLSLMPRVDIGSHTVRHSPLTVYDEAGQRAETAQSRSALASLLGADVTMFAYPFGDDSSFDDVSVRAVASAGYDLAVTTRPGAVTRDTDPLRLPRHGVLDWDAAEFERRLAAWSTQAQTRRATSPLRRLMRRVRLAAR